MLLGVLESNKMLEEGAHSGSGAERAEARGLADLTLRRLGQIDDVIARFVERPPKGPGHQILRLMTAELVFHGTPPHAAVDLAVRLTQDGKSTGRLSGLINAVGRRIADQGAAIVADQEPDARNMPGWLSHRISSDWGKETMAAIAATHLQPAPHDLSLRTDADAPALAQELGATTLPTSGLRLRDRPQISTLPGYAQGAWWVQDAAAAMPAGLIPNAAGRRVLDICAAPGGKTMQLAAAGAEVTALDISRRRMARLGDNLQRTGLAAQLVTANALSWKAEAPFDAIMLDAPCTATGTIRRHPDLPYRTDGKALQDLTALQSDLLDRAFPWLVPSGTLVYCTCSLFKAEGEDQITAFLARTPGARLAPITADDPVPDDFRTNDGMMRTLPHQWSEMGGLDGFFAARITRVK